MSKTIKSTHLFFSEGASDKVYQAEIIETNGGYLVNCAWGRRGSTLQTGSKTPAPVQMDKAEKIFAKVVGEKTAKGYTEDGTGKAFAGSENAGRVSGYLPQLLNEVSEAEVEALILNPDYCAQPKFDGERRMILRAGAESANRKGLIVLITEEISEAVAENLSHADADLDGELMGSEYAVFDLLRHGGGDLRSLPLRERLKLLGDAFLDSDTAYVTETAYTTEEKRGMRDALRRANQEGIVFKRLDAPYTAGRPSSGGNMLKFKFTTTATVKVMAHNEGKRSVAIAILEATGIWRPVGNVTIPPNAEMPEVGALIEVEYLYAFPQGSLFQPVYKVVRSDLDDTDAVAAQLKFKAA
jgi:bifunctional non-homologous end joining protein LigD